MKSILLRTERLLPFSFVFLYFAISFVPLIFPSLVSNRIRFYYILSIPVFCVLSLTLGVFSLVIIVCKKYKGKAISKFLIAGFTLLSSTCIIIPLCFFLHYVIPRPLPLGSNLIKFDSIVWKDNASIEWNHGISIREQMLRDVVVNILPGKNRLEIETLLGPSLKTEYFKTSNKDLIYFLGPERDGFINIDSEWLLIWLDDKGVFKKYVIAND